VIQEHAYDHCHGRVSGHVYIYPNPMGHTLNSFASIEYEFGIRSKREGDSESGPGKSRNGSIISRLVPEGSKTLPRYIERCRKKLGQTGVFMECLEWTGRFQMGLEVYGRFRKVPRRSGLS
jgi:hypothetical protein